MHAAGLLTTAAMAAGLAATSPPGDVAVSAGATANTSWPGGVGSPAAKKAVLNVAELANMLAAGDVKIVTGSGATNIVVKAAFSWTNASRLTLDAIQSVEFDKPVTVAGSGA